MAASTSSLPNNNDPEATSFPPSIGSQNVTGRTSTTNEFIRVVVQRRHKRFFLLPPKLRGLRTSQEVMKELREVEKQEISRIQVLKPVRQFLLITVIEIVSISTSTFQSSNVNVERQEPVPLEVIVTSRIPSGELTAAFRRACLLQSSGAFADQYPLLASNPPSQTALLIGQELNKGAVFWALFAALLVSLGIGLVVGFGCSSAGLAVAVTGGLTGMISVLTALLIWVLK